MVLSELQKKRLRGLGHRLNPVVMIGEAGLSTSLFDEFQSSLAHHELIKIKVRVGDRAARDAIIKELCERGPAELVQRIGNTALLYRENPDKQRISPPGDRQT